MLHAYHMPDAARRAAPTDNETCVRLLLNRRGAGNGEAPRGAARRLIEGLNMLLFLVLAPGLSPPGVLSVDADAVAIKERAQPFTRIEWE